VQSGKYNQRFANLSGAPLIILSENKSIPRLGKSTSFSTRSTSAFAGASYRNPFTNKITISIPREQEHIRQVVSVHDMRGALLFSREPNKGVAIFDTPDLPAGII
jgi:hypothetical protein